MEFEENIVEWSEIEHEINYLVFSTDTDDYKQMKSFENCNIEIEHWKKINIIPNTFVKEGEQMHIAHSNIGSFCQIHSNPHHTTWQYSLLLQFVNKYT